MTQAGAVSSRSELRRSLESLFKVALYSAVLSCTERAAAPVRNVEQKSAAQQKSSAERSSATSCPREPGERVFRIHYYQIGIETYAAVTIDHVEKHGVVCCFKMPAETAQLTKILASATPPGIPDDEFGSGSKVRVIVKENDDTGEKLRAIVEQRSNAESGAVSGVVRRDGMAKPLSEAAMTDLKLLIETRCRWYDD
jgi:hypothetical protein